VADALEHLDRSGGAAARAVHEQCGHHEADEPPGQAGQLGTLRLEAEYASTEQDRSLGQTDQGTLKPTLRNSKTQLPQTS
jgi:hypothetical protein